MRDKNQIIVTREPAALTCRYTLSLSTRRVFQLILDFIKRSSLSRRRGFVQLETGQRSVDVKTSQRWHRGVLWSLDGWDTDEACGVMMSSHTHTHRQSDHLNAFISLWSTGKNTCCLWSYSVVRSEGKNKDKIMTRTDCDKVRLLIIVETIDFEHQPQISSFEVICGSSCGPTVGSVSGTWCEVHSYWDKDKNVFTVAWRKTCSPVRSVRPNQHDHRSWEEECRFDLHSSEPFWHFFLVNHDECLAGNRR